MALFQNNKTLTLSSQHVSSKKDQQQSRQRISLHRHRPMFHFLVQQRYYEITADNLKFLQNLQKERTDLQFRVLFKKFIRFRIFRIQFQNSKITSRDPFSIVFLLFQTKSKIFHLNFFIKISFYFFAWTKSVSNKYFPAFLCI